MLLNCDVRENPWESLELQGDPTSPSKRRSVLGVLWKDWWWSWNSNTLVTWWEELTHLKRPWCWERLKVGEGDEMVGWHHWLNGYEFEQALGADDGQGSLVCCSPWGRKELDTTERMNWTEGLLILMTFSSPFYLASGGFVAAPSLLAFFFESVLWISGNVMQAGALSTRSGGL